MENEPHYFFSIIIKAHALRRLGYSGQQGLCQPFARKIVRKEFESAFRLSRPLAAYKGMASPSRYRAAGTCVPYRCLVPRTRQVAENAHFAASRSCTCSHNLTAKLVCLFAAYMPGFPARLRDRRLWRFLLGFLPILIIYCFQYDIQ